MRAKEFLSRNGVSYTERDVVADPRAAQELVALGFRTVPVVLVEHTAIAGFKHQELAKVLGLTLRDGPREITEILTLIEEGLVAVERAIHEIPQERFTWETPGRARTMGEFAYHIAAAVANVTEGIDRGAYIAPNATRWNDAWKEVRSFQEIATFTSNVNAGFCAWRAQQDLAHLATLQLTDADAAPAVERLDQIAGHTVHHLRQLYWVLRHFGIEPRDPVPDSRFPQDLVLPIVDSTGRLA